MHRQIASLSRGEDEDILEIGAGTLNHLQWEKQYATYDVVEPSQMLIERSDHAQAIRKVYQSIAEIEGVQRYDRILSIAVLEHLEDLPLEIARAALLLKQGGMFCAGVPSEGSALWYLAWRFGTGLSYKRRTGLDYSIVMKYEHLNNWCEIKEVMDWLFIETKITRFPVPIFHLSLYTVIIAQGVYKERCLEYIDSKLE
jgi:2-polyprenyl-3-methyl-5-hydroxy-6-metoxy-1,4-benzoquinol methylase